jgi:hypothetical protein
MMEACLCYGRWTPDIVADIYPVYEYVLQMMDVRPRHIEPVGLIMYTASKHWLGNLDRYIPVVDIIDTPNRRKYRTCDIPIIQYPEHK